MAVTRSPLRIVWRTTLGAILLGAGLGGALLLERNGAGEPSPVPRSDSLVAPAPVPQAPAPSAAAQNGARKSDHLAPQPVAPSAADVAAAPAASGAALTNPLGELGVKLVGTVNAGSPQDSSAVFEDAEQGISTHHIGDTVQPSGARLEEIGRQQAVLSYQGRRITLQVQAATAKAPRVASDQLTADELFQMPTAQLDRMLGSEEKRLAVDLAQAVRDLETMGQFSPAPQGSRGLSVESVQEGSPLAIVGLEPGDVILKVDGKPLRSKDDGLRVLAESLYSEGGSTVLSVRRLGSSMQIAMGSGALLPRDPAAATAR